MFDLGTDEINLISGGLSAETVGCAIGGAAGGALTGGNPVGQVAGCIIGAAVANGDMSGPATTSVSGPGGWMGFISWVYR